MGSSNLRQRVLVATIGVPVLFALAILSKWSLLIAVDVIIFLGLREFFTLAQRKGANPNQIWGIISSLAISWDFCLTRGQHTVIIVGVTLLLLLVLELSQKRTSSPLANISSTLMGIFFVGFLLSHLLLVRQLPGSFGSTPLLGGYLVVLIFSLIWMCDTVAYFVGLSLGRHKLLPRISPNKTIEGAIGGLLGAVAIGLVGYSFFTHILKVPDLRALDYLTLGILAGVVGQVGDLVESQFKRDAEVKEASRILPGHGGILDRFDSLILATPVLYYYLRLVVFG